MATGEASGAVSPWRMIRADADYRRYWLARVTSLAGDLVTYVVLPVLVYRMTRSTFLTAVTGGLASGSYVLVGLVAGALSDRWPRQRVMVTADSISAVVVLSVPVAGVFGRLTIGHVLAAAAAVQVLFVFFDGANFGALPVLVGRDRVAVANAGVWAASSVTEIVAPPFAGAALAAIAPERLLVLDATSYLVSALLVARIRRPLHDPGRTVPPMSARRLGSEIGDGLRYLWRHVTVRRMTAITGLQGVTAGGFVALLVPWSDQVIRAGTSGLRFGALFGAWSVGGLAASLVLPGITRGRSSIAVVRLLIPWSAALAFATALLTSWPAAVVVLLLWGGVSTLISITAISYRQSVTPEALLGRVNTAGRMLSWGIGGTSGALVAGAIAGRWGVRASLGVLACSCLLSVAVAWRPPPPEPAA